jgi:hypothetical protein
LSADYAEILPGGRLARVRACPPFRQVLMDVVELHDGYAIVKPRGEWGGPVEILLCRGCHRLRLGRLADDELALRWCNHCHRYPDDEAPTRAPEEVAC